MAIFWKPCGEKSTEVKVNSTKVIAFDCDGVLFDSANANRSYFNHILNHFGKADMTDGQFAYVHMHTTDEAIFYLFAGDQRVDEAKSYSKKMGYEAFIPHMKIEPYLRPLLKRLRPDFKTAIATNRTDTMRRVLEAYQLEDSFDLVVSAMDVVYPKPHPEALLRVLNFFNIQSDQALYVGDSLLDEQAAKAAGIPLAAYGNPSLSADYHISSLKELETILDL